jgi:hypothetical protein
MDANVYTYMMHTIKLLFNYIYVGARRRVLVHSVNLIVAI